MEQQRNLILAIVISAVIWLGFFFLYERPRMVQQQAAQQAAQQMAQSQTPSASSGTGTPTTSAAPGAATVEAPAAVVGDRATVLEQSPRVPIVSARLKGSINLKGGRIDDVVLATYRETVAPNSPNIVLLTPSGAPDAYFAELGWIGEGVKLPDGNSLWQADADKLTPERPLTLTWDNGDGLHFSRIVSLDSNFMITVVERVESARSAPVDLYAYGRMQRVGTPKSVGSTILHEGPIGVFGGGADDARYILNDKASYKKLLDDGLCNSPTKQYKFESVGGWLGFTDKYWLVALVPDQKQQLHACFHWEKQGSADVYQGDFTGVAVTLAPGAKVESTTSLFVGAKEVPLLADYRDNFRGQGIPLFDRSVDFSGYVPAGVLTYIAKPLFYLLHYIHSVVGNFGIAIMVLTVIVKIVFFPLANKSYRAMNKMKKLTPQMTELRERFADDKAKLNQEMMALYKREKVNPAAGCLPILVQIPVFIALYQVLYVTIEMRQAPFFGWIKDLSAPDPTSIVNLFGLLPYHVPDLGPLNFISIGVLPIIMGITMFLQQKMNPPPPDPVQAKIMMTLPIVFTFMLGRQFAVGLVIYWAWNNTLSILQQWLLKRTDDSHAPKR